MWQDCLNKHLIGANTDRDVIKETNLEPAITEQRKVIFQGSGVFVQKKITSDKYFHPTSVIITGKAYIWNLCFGARSAILAWIIHMHDDLKTFNLLKDRVIQLDGRNLPHKSGKTYLSLLRAGYGIT